MDLSVDLANAQAFLDGGLKRVRLFGGLVRHRRIGSAGLAVAIAHETGHHLGGAPYLEFYRWLSSEARATEWALAHGLEQVFGSTAGKKIAQRGLSQLRALSLVD